MRAETLNDLQLLLTHLLPFKSMPKENDQESATDPLTVGELISLPQAAELSGFSHSYLKEIAQKGRLRAKKIGRNWVTTLLAVEEYKKTRNSINIPKKYRDRS